MLRHEWLYDPIKRTEDMKLSEFTKYIQIRDDQVKSGTLTDPQVVAKIHDIFYSEHPGVTPSKLDKIWQHIGPMAEHNAAFAQFVLDYGGAESEYFFPWLLSVAISPSAALEMAYGAGYNLSGNWVDIVPETDKIDFFVRNVPTFVYNRERQLYVADLVSSTQEKCGMNCRCSFRRDGTRVVDLGAGRMAWARWHGFHFDPCHQEILALDKDPSITTPGLFPMSLKRLNIQYRSIDIRSWLTENTEENGFDLAILGGVASYYPLEAFIQTVIKPVCARLSPGGVFFFDLQLDCPQYVWTVKLFNWPEIKLMRDATEAITTLEAMRKQLWHEGLKFGAEYAVDTYNEAPSAVMVTLTKI